jgi:hypothetical protein
MAENRNPSVGGAGASGSFVPTKNQVPVPQRRTAFKPPGDDAIIIVVEPADRHDRWRAQLADDEVIVLASRQPFVDSARRLLERGHDPATVLLMRHKDSGVDSLRGQIGIAAGLTICERDDGRTPPTFKRWRPFPRTPVSPRSAANEGAGREEPEQELAGRPARTDDRDDLATGGGP